jgi:hypothetical protein
MKKLIAVWMMACLAVAPALVAGDEKEPAKETPPCCAKQKAAEQASSGCCKKECSDTAKSGCPASAESPKCPVTGKVAKDAAKEGGKCPAGEAAKQPAKNADQASK